MVTTVLQCRPKPDTPSIQKVGKAQKKECIGRMHSSGDHATIIKQDLKETKSCDRIALRGRKFKFWPLKISSGTELVKLKT